jgi:RNA polymerase sigma-70 factor (ECF subfamily)
MTSSSIIGDPRARSRQATLPAGLDSGEAHATGDDDRLGDHHGKEAGTRMGTHQHLDELAVQAARGDTTALDALLAEIQPTVLRRCSRLLPCRQDAEEACQDTLMQVARTIASFEGRSRFSTWLYVVTGNCVRQTYRGLKKRAAEAPDVLVPEHRPEPRTTIVIAGTRIDFLDALDTLEEHRADLVTPVVLRDVAGLDYTEIADRLDLPLGTVKSRINQARRRLRGMLADRGR